MTRPSGHPFLAAILAAVVFCLPLLTHADAPTAPDIRRIETYLNDLKSLEARFVQNNPDGSYAAGSLYLLRPGRMRFEYDPPVPIRLFANGNFLTHVDTELEQVSHYPLDETPAHFLLRERISLSEGVEIRHFHKENKVIRVELVDQENPDVGSVALTFSDAPLELRAWTVTDSQGLRTELALVDARFGGTLDLSLFEFVDTYTNPTDQGN